MFAPGNWLALGGRSAVQGVPRVAGRCMGRNFRVVARCKQEDRKSLPQGFDGVALRYFSRIDWQSEVSCVGYVFLHGSYLGTSK